MKIYTGASSACLEELANPDSLAGVLAARTQDGTVQGLYRYLGMRALKVCILFLCPENVVCFLCVLDIFKCTSD